MECARGVAKRQRVSTVASALANIDVLGLLATFLDADELCQVKATCKALGSRDESAFEGLSMTEEAARRIFEQSASDEEKGMLPRHDGEGWIELYHHLLMLRARLTFDQLIGVDYISYQEDDEAAVETTLCDFSEGESSAICGNHIVRVGKHWATFNCSSSRACLGSQSVGVIRPLPGWDQRSLDEFHPATPIFWEDLRRERTSRWEGDVDFCRFSLCEEGECYYSNWGVPPESESTWEDWEGVDNYDGRIGELGMLLDLDSGTLSVYQDGRRLGTLNDGLAGVYCWFACFTGRGHASIKRGYKVINA